jgi:molecular chaperone GrpE (heat shock protein)
MQDAARAEQDQAAEEALRPLLKTLVDLYDALSLAQRELVRVQETVLPAFDKLSADGQAPSDLPAANDSPSRRPSLWARWFGQGQAGSAERTALEQRVQTLREREQQASEAARRARGFLESIITGYTMSLQRVERALHQHGLESIPSVGWPFDPERMEVLEAVTDSGRPAGEVLDEVRRGYLWHDRIFRCAQVRVAK